jgi:stringent starvation protein B
MTNKKQQCYPLCFFSSWPIKNNSVTPHILFDKNNSVTPYVLFDKNNSVTPYVFFHDDQ